MLKRQPWSKLGLIVVGISMLILSVYRLVSQQLNGKQPRFSTALFPKLRYLQSLKNKWAGINRDTTVAISSSPSQKKHVLMSSPY